MRLKALRLVTDVGLERPDVPSDAEITACMEAGNRDEAVRLLMKRHGDEVYGYCCESLDDPALADDVLQKVFVEVHRALHRFGGRSSLRTWIFAIARNRVIDVLRARKKAIARTGTLPHDPEDERPLATELLDEERLHEALRSCLGDLGEHVRTAVLLRYQQGFSYEEMAAVCNEKPGTLQARVARALPLLKACIEKKTGGSV
jgi:RNA polymerase sigma-70 factor (ECF subfamily)